jgi:tetratricopeptide (TPR) repeat protein
MHPLGRLQGESRQRNFWLAHVLSWSRLVESEGAGIPRAVDDCRRQQAAEPIVTRIGGAVTVTVFPREDAALEAIRAAASPVVDNLPLRSPVFEGRDVAVLADLMDGAQNGEVVATAVCGLGGIGKTELALHYASRYRDRYRLLWWITADTLENVGLGLASLASRLHPTGTLADAESWAVDWLQNNREWLLILDNMEEISAVEPLLGQLAGRGRVLITTRRNLGTARWAKLGLAPLQLDVLGRTASIRMLALLSGVTDVEGAGRLAEALGDLPLALEQAAAYISQHNGLGFDDYRRLLAMHSARILDRSGEGGTRERAVAQVWQVSLSAVAERAPLAEQVIHVMAWLAPDALPEDILLPLAGDPLELTEALAVLASYSLLNHSEGMLRSHRLVQAVTRAASSSSAKGTGAAIQAAAILRQALPPDPVANVAGWPRWNVLLPHIDALSEKVGEDSPSTDLLYAADQAATYRLFQGQVSAAITQFEQVLAGRRARLGDEHPETLTSRHNLASAYQTVGRLLEAIALHEQVLSDYRRLLGDNHPDTLASRNNLARAYQASGRLPEAIALHERVFADSRLVLGELNADTLASRHNLALAYADAGRLSEAIASLEEVLAARRRVLGEDHPASLATRNSISRLYASAGRVAEATTLYEQVLTDRQRVLGDDHPDTLTSRNNLASAYASAGRVAEATTLYEQVLTDRQRVLGDDHPDTLSTLAWLQAAHDVN